MSYYLTLPPYHVYIQHLRSLNSFAASAPFDAFGVGELVVEEQALYFQRKTYEMCSLMVLVTDGDVVVDRHSGLSFSRRIVGVCGMRVGR